MMAYGSDWDDEQYQNFTMTIIESWENEMREWFFSNYENPVHKCPYDKGFHYIYGGPYNALDVLSQQFSGKYPDELIEEIANELSEDCEEWSGTGEEEFYEMELYELNSAIENNNPFENFRFGMDCLSQIKAYLTIENRDDREPLYRLQKMMLFVSCITVLETYLSDVFKIQVRNSKENKRLFLKTKNFNEKIEIKDIFQHFEQLEGTIQQKINELNFHNLPMVKSLFNQVLKIDIGEIEELNKSIKNRHDFVHRSGKDLQGNRIDVSLIEVEALIQNIKEFCDNINNKIINKAVI